MRTEVKVFLEIMRAASRRTGVTPEFMDVLREAIPMTKSESEEVTEILAGDLREVNDTIERIKQIKGERLQSPELAGE